MKKVLKSIFLICLSLIMMLPVTAYAEETQPEWNNITLSQEEIDEILAPYEVNNSNARASGLITAYAIGLQKSGSNLLIVGKTNCAPDVTKCGFSEIIVQRRKTNSDSWAQYTKYTDLYSNSTGYVLTKSITPPSGYQYRITCKHYAKKSLFSTETITNISNIVSM